MLVYINNLEKTTGEISSLSMHHFKMGAML